MNSKRQYLKRIPEIYEKVKKWVIYVDIIFLAVLFSLGQFFGYWYVELIAAGVFAILLILFEVLLSISSSLQTRPEMSAFPSIYEALPKIKEIVSRDKQTTSVKIIAATGGTTLATILPSIKAASSAQRIEVAIGILDPRTRYKEWIPQHWPSESKTSIARLRTEFNDRRTSVDTFRFEILPVTHGLLINDEHLFLGFYSWTRSDDKRQLSGAQLPHYYYHKSKPEYTYYFDLFDSWFRYCPRRSNNQKLFVFDFDGVLADSYSCLPDVYACVAQDVGLQGDTASKFVDAMIKAEDQQDTLRNYNRHTWWPEVFGQFGIHVSRETLKQLIESYWESRAGRMKVINQSEQILKSLENQGVLALVCAGDGQYGNKRNRIKKSGLGTFFDEVIIIGEDAENLTQAVQSLTEKRSIDRGEVIVFDDKPFSINEISQNTKDVKTVKIEFEGILKLAWAEECTPTYRVGTIDEVKGILEQFIQGDEG